MQGSDNRSPFKNKISILAIEKHRKSTVYYEVRQLYYVRCGCCGSRIYVGGPTKGKRGTEVPRPFGFDNKGASALAAVCRTVGAGAPVSECGRHHLAIAGLTRQGCEKLRRFKYKSPAPVTARGRGVGANNLCRKRTSGARTYRIRRAWSLSARRCQMPSFDANGR